MADYSPEILDSLDVVTNGAGLTAIASFLLSALELLGPTLLAWARWESSVDRAMQTIRGYEDAFDFIVVGSGSGGSIVASKLSETYRVLLLEAGGTPNAWQRVPVITYLLHGQEPIDWQWRTVPQKAACFGLRNNVSYWAAGKGLGGSSNINGIIAYRGLVQGFDAMANRTGNPAWTMDNMLSIYRDLEDYHGYFDERGPKGHGKGGTLSMEKSHLHPVSQQFLKAGEELGYKVRDPNALGPITDGFSPMDFYTKRGRRWSAYHEYIKGAMRRKNLTVRKFATVTKVLIDHRNRAYGIEYFKGGKYRIAKSSKEVILSAGSIQSAKLLMLSGVGPREHLEDIGIKVRVNLPVGQILQDKYGALIGPFVSSPNTSFLRDRDGNIETTSEWLVNGTGPIQCSRTEATFTVSSSMAAKGFPDIHAYFLAYSLDTRYKRDFATAFNFKPDLLQDYYDLAYGRDSFFQSVTLVRPEGTGTLRLRSKDPFAQPLIDPKYLQNKRDVQVLVEAIKMAVKLVDKTQSYRQLDAHLLHTPIPGCEGYKLESDSYWECYGRTTTLTAYKYSGTAPMGRDMSDPDAVVDSELRVFGVKGLRVVDASVLQVRELGVNHGTVQGFAVQASRIIAKYWKDSSSSSRII